MSITYQELIDKAPQDWDFVVPCIPDSTYYRYDGAMTYYFTDDGEWEEVLDVDEHLHYNGSETVRRQELERIVELLNEQNIAD